MFKPMLLAATMATSMLAGTAFAQADQQDQCKQAQGFAQQVMQQRQSGMSKEDQVKQLTSAKQISSEQKKALEQLVSAAYDQPKHKSKKDQEKAARDFGQRAYQGCTQEMQKNQ